MRRWIVVITCVLSVALLTAAPAVAATKPAPRPLGRSYTQWLQTVGQFFLGDASNPLIAGLEGDCGELQDGVFLLAAPISLDQQFDCEVPVGTWIVLSHAAAFSTAGVDGDTDAELEAAARALFDTRVNTLTLDGHPLRLRTTDTGAFDVISQEGSFYDTVLGVGTGAIRTVVVGNVTLIHPLSPGEHVIETEVLFADGEHYSATYRITVG